MTRLKTIKFEQEFESIDALYQSLIKNIDFIENKIGIRIGDNELTPRPFCITGKEEITERQILFYATENTLPCSLFNNIDVIPRKKQFREAIFHKIKDFGKRRQNIGELIVLAGAFKEDILIFIVDKINPTKSKLIKSLSQSSKLRL